MSNRSLPPCSFASTRITVERAFGVFVSRFGILWRPLRGRLSNIVAIIRACARIHNLCIDEKDVVSMQRTEGLDPNSRDNTVHVDAFPAETQQGRRRDTEGVTRRLQLTRSLDGMVRPPRSSFGVNAMRV